MEHTPGPWTVDIDEELWGVYTVNEAVTQLVEEMAPSDETMIIDRANARLIAAAPALLRELKDVVERMERTQRILRDHNNEPSSWMVLDTQSPRSTIARATGDDHGHE